MGLKRGIGVSVMYRVGRRMTKGVLIGTSLSTHRPGSTEWFPHLKVILKDLVWVWWRWSGLRTVTHWKWQDLDAGSQSTPWLVLKLACSNPDPRDFLKTFSSVPSWQCLMIMPSEKCPSRVSALFSWRQRGSRRLEWVFNVFYQNVWMALLDTFDHS